MDTIVKKDEMIDAILRIKDINKSFSGVKVLKGLNIDIEAGTVHSLMGENGAGKSTLMKCIFGMYKPDSGDIIYKGQKVNFKSTKEALELGISMIHQELNTVAYRTVYDNLFLGNYKHKNILGIKVTNDKELAKQCKNLLSELDFDIDPGTMMKELSVSQMQLIEIAKAVSYNAKVIIMDEPTSSLTNSEVEKLFKIIDTLKSRGIAIIYISHKMEEILRISDRVTIMRDGNHIGTYRASELDMDTIISKMVGRDLGNRYPVKNNVVLEEEILRVENLTSINKKSFKNISFSVKKGEILGFAGLVGAQRTETLESVFGLRHVEQGKIYINNELVKINAPKQAIQNKIALLTEDRRRNGIFPVLNIVNNMLVSSLPDYKSSFILDNKKLKKTTSEEIKKLNIKTESEQQLIKYLSGGNQQKVIFSKWILTEPDVLILDEPTRGIDVGAKYEIYKIIIDLAARGKSIIVISSEIPELLGVTDRILVMCDGRITADLKTSETNQEEIMKYAFLFN